MNHIDRMLDERSELMIKVHRLQTFVGSEMFAALPVIDQDLMRTQRYVMHLYINLLTQRIQRATVEPPSALA
jgi:hypothetical protein